MKIPIRPEKQTQLVFLSNVKEWVRCKKGYKNVWRGVWKDCQGCEGEKDTKDNGRDMMMEFNMTDTFPSPKPILLPY